MCRATLLALPSTAAVQFHCNTPDESSMQYALSLARASPYRCAPLCLLEISKMLLVRVKSQLCLLCVMHIWS